jgi:hypothetical protein
MLIAESFPSAQRVPVLFDVGCLSPSRPARAAHCMRGIEPDFAASILNGGVVAVASRISGHEQNRSAQGPTAPD